MNPLRPAAYALSLLLATSAARAAGEWPQFRGPGGQGIAEAKELPVTWGETENVTWKTAIHGKAWSSPVIWGDQIWLTTATEDAHELFTLCVDKKTGKIVHDLKLFDVPTPQFIHPFNSAASPTPAIEEGRVYITFGAPGTACLDTATGKVVWERRDILINHFRGAGSSPFIYGDLLIMNYDGSDFQFITALDKKTGKTVWKTTRSLDYQDLDATGKPKLDGDMRKAFSTPRVATHGGKPALLSVSSKAMYAYDPATGEELWRVENRNAHSASATPVVGPDLIYFGTGQGRPELWAIRPGGHGVVTDTHVAWKVTKNVPTRGTCLLVDDLIYMVDDNGVASCVEAATGKEVWKNRLNGKNYSAAPLLADGHIYFLSEEGKSETLAPGREFKVLGQGQVESGYLASPAVADNALFVRTKTHLYRVEKKS